MKALKTILIIALGVMLLTNCNTVKKITKGGDKAEPVIPKALGGKAGKQIDKYMDEQVAELNTTLKNASIVKEKEQIRITFESGVLFAVSSADLGILAKANVTKLATVLNKYPDTRILVEGHTDDTGNLEFNNALSADRAKSVASFLASKGVDLNRIKPIGYGPSKPKVENNSAANRALNRRVELVVYASESLIEKAKKKQL